MPLSPPELEPLLRLSLVQGIGHGRLAKLIEKFGSAEAVLRAPVAALRGVPGIGGELARRIARPAGAAAADAQRALRKLQAARAVGLTPDDPEYPSSFRSLESAPYLLFASGDLECIRRSGIAVVGTRSPSRYGSEVARRISAELTRFDMVVVSGLARGIDTAAHTGAVEAGGATIAILGNGIEQVYPPENHRLLRAIRERGLLLTEYPPGETPKPGNFPRRNRLIAALSEAVVVVEMGLKSGAQHTVNFALEQGREVLAVPGPVTSVRSSGTNQLIRDGARLVTSAADVIEELRGVGSAGVASERSQQQQMLLPEDAAPARWLGRSAEPTAPVTLSLFDEPQAAVIRAMDGRPIHVDRLARAAGLSPSEILSTLLELELRGVVRALPGMHYIRV